MSALDDRFKGNLRKFDTMLELPAASNPTAGDTCKKFGLKIEAQPRMLFTETLILITLYGVSNTGGKVGNIWKLD